MSDAPRPPRPAGKRDAPAVIVDVLPFETPAGHTKYRRDDAGVIMGMSFGCPCGCGRAYGASWPRWTWDGNVEKPTVTPSLGCYPSGKSLAGPDGVYHWHGYLVAGVFEEC